MQLDEAVVMWEPLPSHDDTRRSSRYEIETLDRVVRSA